MPLKGADRNAIDEAIAAGALPRPPIRGRGLVYGLLGTKPRRLMDEVGNLTPAGQYYYEVTARAPPKPGPGAFDPHQEPTRRGNRYYAKLLDGTKAVLRTFDPVKQEWKHSKLGKKFYKKSVDRDVSSDRIPFAGQWNVLRGEDCAEEHGRGTR